MKNLLYITALITLASCGTTRKSINRFSQEVKRSESFQKDSSDSKITHSVSLTVDSNGFYKTMDSIYYRIIEEQIIEINNPHGDTTIDTRPNMPSGNDPDGYFYAPPGATIKMTKRTIKDRGQKKTESNTLVVKKDSVFIKKTEAVYVTTTKQVDSAGTTHIANKNLYRSGVRWYVWTIACLVIGGVVWWRRRQIALRFFGIKSKSKL